MYFGKNIRNGFLARLVGYLTFTNLRRSKETLLAEYAKIGLKWNDIRDLGNILFWKSHTVCQLNVYLGNPRYGFYFYSQFSINDNRIKANFCFSGGSEKSRFRWIHKELGGFLYEEEIELFCFINFFILLACRSRSWSLWVFKITIFVNVFVLLQFGCVILSRFQLSPIWESAAFFHARSHRRPPNLKVRRCSYVHEFKQDIDFVCPLWMLTHIFFCKLRTWRTWNTMAVWK